MAKTEKNLNGKILAVKSSIGKIGKDGSSIVGGGRKIKYATLPTILEKVVPIMAEFGIDYQISVVLNADTLPLISQNIRVFSLNFIDTESGEKSEPILFPFRLANNSEAIKADGSTITYATRYLLGMALGLQTEEDPDAKFPTQQPTQQQQQTKKRTFEECKNGFYAVYNQGNIEGAKKTLDFVIANWGNTPEHQDEIRTMQSVDLTTNNADDKPPF